MNPTREDDPLSAVFKPIIHEDISAQQKSHEADPCGAGSEISGDAYIKQTSHDGRARRIRLTRTLCMLIFYLATVKEEIQIIIIVKTPVRSYDRQRIGC